MSMVKPRIQLSKLQLVLHSKPLVKTIGQVKMCALGQVILDLEYIHLIKWITLTWCILWYSDSMASLLDRKRQKLVDHSDKVQMLRGTINSLREEKLRIENDLQQRIKLEEDKANWAAETEACKREIQVSGYMLMQGWWDFYKNEYLKIVTKYVRL